MSDDVRGRRAGGVENRRHVPDRMGELVVLLALRAAGVTESAQVGCYHPEASGGQGGDLVAPQPGVIRPAVYQQHGVAVTVAVDLDIELGTVRGYSHRIILIGCAPDGKRRSA